MRVASKLGTLIFLCSSCANFGNSSHSSSVLPTIDELSSISLDFHDLEGNFDGTPFFTDVLRAADRNWFKRVIKSHNFPTATLHSSCKVLVTGGGVSVANLDARQKEVASKLKSPRVFLVVNAEDKSGEENYARMNDDIEKDDPVVILGTWFNSRTRNYRSLSRGLSSIYVPFGSINLLSGTNILLWIWLIDLRILGSTTEQMSLARMVCQLSLLHFNMVFEICIV